MTQRGDKNRRSVGDREPDADGASGSRNWLYRLGRFAANRRGWVVAGWILFALAMVLANQSIGGATVDDF